MSNNCNVVSVGEDSSCVYIKTYVPDDNFESYLESYGMGDGILNNDSVITVIGFKN